MANLKSTIINDTGFLQLPSGTTAERPASPTAGEIRFNTDTKVCEWYDSELDSWFPTGVVPPVATGGTVEDVDIDGVTYRIHSFTTVGSSDFTVTRGGLVDYLIVAGGGSGGVGRSSSSCVSGSGGGAGGLLTGSITIAPQTYTISVGAGGVSQTSAETPGNNGENSSAFNITAIGGGGGGSRNRDNTNGVPGRSGGSGGGGNHATFALAGSGTPGQGNPGGHGFVEGGSGGCIPGTGGGAGFPGELGFQGRDNSGGTGIYLGSVFTENYGENGFFAGGGAAGINGSGHSSKGGIGGAVDQPSSRVTPDPGLPNTGAGGCGGADGGSGFTNSGAGGSGIVIIRYRIS